jgi:hypothetical protein
VTGNNYNGKGKLIMSSKQQEQRTVEYELHFMDDR